jgi:DNA recombination protein RmuC
MQEIIVIGLIVIASVAIATYFIIKAIKSNNSQDEATASLKDLQNQGFNLLHQRLDNVTNTLDKKLADAQKQNQVQYGQSTKVITEITQKLTEITETNKQVVNFADQLQNLQDILNNPKQRGILGEFYLESVLKNTLPPKNYATQYEVGAIEGKKLVVDAAVFVKDKIIPIDAKFSLENYNRVINLPNGQDRTALITAFKNDLKARIDETSKYIMPEAGTMDFAFMFIPSEAIYYDLLANQVGNTKTQTQDLIEYAFKQKRVIIVSPTSFFAYLQTVLQGLRALEIEKSAQNIKKRVEELRRHLGVFDEHMQKMGKHLGNTVSAYNNSYKEFGKIDKDIVRITEAERQVEVQQLSKPELD